MVEDVSSKERVPKMRFISRHGSGDRSSVQRGFTLIELMIVISIILILLSFAIPIFKQSVLKAKESTLRNDLTTLRTMIDEYTKDKKKAPQSLDDLVSAGYLKEIPKDPITDEPNWTPVESEVMQYLDQTDSGIDDVHSSSTLVSSEGTPYSEW